MTTEGAILSRLVKNMKKRGADPLRPLLEQYLLERGRADVRHVVEPIDMTPPRRPGGRLSPSGLCGCEREAVLRFTGVDGRRVINPDLELVFDDGNWRHHKWQATFKDMELVLGRHVFRCLSVEQKVVIPDLYVAGSLDVTIAIRINGKWRKFVIDIKGINDMGFGVVLRNDAPISHHVKQLVAYERAAGIPRGFLWYENKNNQNTLAFNVGWDDDAWRDVEAWCTSVVSYLKRKRLPPKHPECARGTLHFERCPFSHLCFGRQERTMPLRTLAYQSFPGIDDAWERGNEDA